MVQTGDPTGTGKGGSSIWGDTFRDEIKEDLKHKTRGIVSMANSGPNTNGSQFFVTYAEQPSLDLKYTVFGKVGKRSPVLCRAVCVSVRLAVRSFFWPFTPAHFERSSQVSAH